MALKLNPHGILKAIDPPRDHPPRRFRCHYCEAVGLYDELQAVACTYVYPPCEFCGQTPECAADCAGIAAILGSPDVHVVGMKKPKLPEA